MGATHHALEDIAVLSALPHFACFIPLCNSDVDGACAALFQHVGPSYLRLGFGVWPDDAGKLEGFKPIRKLACSRLARPKATVVGLGPVLLNVLPWILEGAETDVFAVSQMPLVDPSDQLLASLRASGLLWVIEEHTARGGLGEHLAARMAQQGVPFRLHHTYAVGYPDGLYGSQSYHQSRSGLDPVSLEQMFQRLSS
jgi:transketolase